MLQTRVRTRNFRRETTAHFVYDYARKLEHMLAELFLEDNLDVLQGVTYHDVISAAPQRDCIGALLVLRAALNQIPLTLEERS